MKCLQVWFSLICVLLLMALCAEGVTHGTDTQAASLQSRVVRAATVAATPGETVRVPITISAQGDEVGIQFSLNYDPALLSNPQAEAGSDAANNQFFEVNTGQMAQGQFGVILLLRAALAPGTRQIVVVRFQVAATAPAGQQIPITFGSTPTRQRVIDTNANMLTTNYEPGAITLSIQTADLTISKTHTGNFAAGQNGVYTITVRNLGTAASSGTLAVTDTLPSGLSFVSNAGAGWSCAPAGQVVTCTNPSPLNGGAASSFTLTVGVANTAAGSVTNTVMLSNASDATPANNSASDLTNIAAQVVSVSAASFSGAALAPEAIVSAFGLSLANTTQVANGLPLPTTLAGTSLRVRDSLGGERLAPLFFISPSQINYLMPAGTALGTATVTVTSSDGKLSIGQVRIGNVAPGLFTANANGQGVPAAVLLRVRTNGAQSLEQVARFDAATGRFVPAPIALGPPGEQVFLVLFGTGWRYRSALTAVTVRCGGVVSEVFFAGAQGDLVGMDQLNLQLPRELAGRGEVDVVLTVEGQLANTVRIAVQ